MACIILVPLFYYYVTSIYKNCNSLFRWVNGLTGPKKDAERSRGTRRISEWIPRCANTVHHGIISQSKGIALDFSR